MCPLRPSYSQLFPLKLDHLPCFDNSPFRFSNPSLKLRSGNLSLCQFPTSRLQVIP
jgi:hypothetical protein